MDLCVLGDKGEGEGNAVGLKILRRGGFIFGIFSFLLSVAGAFFF